MVLRLICLLTVDDDEYEAVGPSGDNEVAGVENDDHDASDDLPQVGIVNNGDGKGVGIVYCLNYLRHCNSTMVTLWELVFLTAS